MTAPATLAPSLRPRADPDLALRLARSAAAEDGHFLSTADVDAWLADRARAHRFRVDRVPLSSLEGWSFAEGTGNLVHRTGRFFSVEGLSASVSEGRARSWQQPVIRQPEVGILGILAKEFDGVLHFLMQAKMEPGNRNLLQLSPTVQATRSNYSSVHGGSRVRYLEYFAGAGGGRVLTDVLQSEHGAWFFRKSNRNMLVEAGADTDVPPHDDFRWLTLGQLGRLLRRDNVVNMDSRTVLACFPAPASDGGALLTDAELQSWFTVERSRHDVDVQRVPLAGVHGWRHGDDVIERADGRYFRVVGVRVEAGSREVGGWDQPLIEPTGTGVTAFLYRTFQGVPHLLVNAKVEAGFLDTVEIAPTVQATPGNWAHLPARDRPPFLGLALDPRADRVRYSAVHSEEGGRFLNAESRYLFIETDASETPLAPPGYQWATPAQLRALTGHGHYVNVQARTLLACLDSGAVRL
ncbi:NDP-hexose 2,3-dehydratase family protein [Streptomyces sp. NPDC058657]|uniref:NDP-hexose 2,3-dehydratase family protein n=1 Tax=unclassified Streptomyces TaxID=2593676 RepID=UPI00365147FC